MTKTHPKIGAAFVWVNMLLWQPFVPLMGNYVGHRAVSCIEGDYVTDIVGAPYIRVLT